jgi:hypothetical protein
MKKLYIVTIVLIGIVFASMLFAGCALMESGTAKPSETVVKFTLPDENDNFQGIQAKATISYIPNASLLFEASHGDDLCAFRPWSVVPDAKTGAFSTKIQCGLQDATLSGVFNPQDDHSPLQFSISGWQRSLS